MTAIAVVNRAPGLDDRDVAFWAEACNQQALEVAGVYEIGYTPVAFFGTAEGLPRDCRVLTIKGAVDAQDGVLGFHDVELGAVFAEVKYVGAETSTVMSHEVVEEMVDPLCNKWAPFDVDHEQAVEPCDRCQSDTYLQWATVLGESRQIPLSNYLYPSAFEAGGMRPFDRMGKLMFAADITPGGYVIVRDIKTGKVGNIFARRAGPRVISGKDALAAVGAKLATPGSRVLRRLRGHVAA